MLPGVATGCSGMGMTWGRASTWGWAEQPTAAWECLPTPACCNAVALAGLSATHLLNCMSLCAADPRRYFGCIVSTSGQLPPDWRLLGGWGAGGSPRPPAGYTGMVQELKSVKKRREKNKRKFLRRCTHYIFSFLAEKLHPCNLIKKKIYPFPSYPDWPLLLITPH